MTVLLQIEEDFCRVCIVLTGENVEAFRVNFNVRHECAVNPNKR